MHTRFSDDAKVQWQWPKEYIPTAKPTDFESEAQLEELGDYDIAKAWTRLREQHAQQCQHFVNAHIDDIITFYTDKLSLPTVVQELSAELQAYWAQRGSYYTDVERQLFSNKARHYTTVMLRKTLAEGEKEYFKAKRDEETRAKKLEEAQALFESADVQTIVAMAKISSDKGNVKNAAPGTTMHYLYKKQLEIIDEYLKGLRRRGGHKSPKKPRSRSGSAKPSRSAPRGHPKSRDCDRRSVHVTGRSPKRTTRYPRTPRLSTSARSGSSSKASSRASSTASVSSKSSGKTSKGGKGGKGKGRARGKGRGRRQG